MFDSAKSRIRRADYHINDAERQISSYFEKHPDGLSVSPISESGDFIFTAKKIPDAIALIICDAIANLRCSLDHLQWELMGHVGGDQNTQTKFPFGRTCAEFNTNIGKLKNTPDCVKNLLRSLEAFPGGRGDCLNKLREFDNDQKHKVIIPFVRFARVKTVTIYNLDGLKLMTIDNISDLTLVSGGTLTVDMGVFSTAGGIKFEGDKKIAAEIFFSDSRPKKPKEYRSTFPTLTEIREAVIATISIVESSLS